MQEEANRNIDSTIPSKAVEKHVLEPPERGTGIEIPTRREQKIQDLFEEALVEKSPFLPIVPRTFKTRHKPSNSRFVEPWKRQDTLKTSFRFIVTRCFGNLV